MCGKVRFCFGGVPFILYVLSVWTIVFFVKNRRNRCRGLDIMTSDSGKLTPDCMRVSLRPISTT